MWRGPANDVGTDNGTDFFGISNVGVSWFTPLFRDPNFWQLFIDRYQAHRQNVYSSNSIVAMVDGFYQTIKEAQVREQAKWAPSSFTYPRAGSQTVNFRRHLLHLRLRPGGQFWPGPFHQRSELPKEMAARPLGLHGHEFPGDADSQFRYGTGFERNNRHRCASGQGQQHLLYTLDGTDPRSLGGAISATAQTNVGPLTLTISNNVRLIARSYNTSHANLTNVGTEVGKPLINSFWSGPAAATYYTGIPSLRVTEIMFHPSRLSGNTNDAENFEYIELKNTGTTALDLTGFKFTDGITFDFTGGAVTNLAPGAYVLVVKNLAAFTGALRRAQQRCRPIRRQPRRQRRAYCGGRARPRAGGRLHLQQ
jgi:hypothetical protein